MTVTIKEIAKLAAVSPGTVSRILNSDPTLSVTESTRKRVKQIAGKLNYENNREQRRKSVATIAVVTSMSEQREVDDPYWRSVHQGIKQAAKQSRVTIAGIFRLTDGLKDIDLSQYSAVIVTGDLSISAIRQIKKINPNLVLVDSRDRLADIDSVNPDLAEMTERILNEFKQSGRQRIAFIGGINERIDLDGQIKNRSKDPRTIAYEKWMSQQQLESNEILGGWSSAAGVDAVKALLQQNKPCDALLIASDVIAIGAIKALQESGLIIGTDLVLASFDDLDTAAYLSPSLTSVNLPQHALGASAVSQASELAQSSRTWTKWVTIPSRLIYRDSFQKNE
ncbi:LacI family DNA-binding transcriptional regulator [Oenococcus sp.]|uniref:LacI family DNA-binding transcriptional regulator n=1 Tax=Oenococcus sp. TaxID=1979414 RepID=UPI0039E99FAF